MDKYVLVTDWDVVDADDFYLTDEKWLDKYDVESIEHMKKLQAEGNLYEAFIVSALNYCIYSQMDSTKVFIDRDQTEIMTCEGEVIGDKHEAAFEYDGY